MATILALATLVVVAGCGDAPSEEELRADVVSALDGLAAELLVDRPSGATEYAARLRAYLEENPAFFGAAAAMLDPAGVVIASPYVYRADGGFASTDLAEPSYNIRSQEWFTAPLAANAGVWTAPYFDAGGGEIWMVTRSLPVSDASGVFVIITTDLPVEAPPQ